MFSNSRCSYFFKRRKSVLTHDGSFHPDDVFSVAVFQGLFKNRLRIIRSREKKEIAKADIVVDVGGVCDFDNDRFDHHQLGGAGSRENGVPYASFGLVWKKYGRQFCGSIELADYADKKLVQFIDCFDNGLGSLQAVFADVLPFTISDFIMNFNTDVIGNRDDNFFKAVAVAGEILSGVLKSGERFFVAERAVGSVYNSTKDKRIIVLDEEYDWFETINRFKEPLFVVEPDGNKKNNHWKVRCVRDEPNCFKNRKNLPALWAGKKDAELVKISGVPDAIFCHNGLFVAVAGSKEGALKLAEIAVFS